ncbi:unnamed protein product [Paramecium primaurelia]|uniref:Transmembrane protein n=1 Tax=Paramecium primaurelia TaxID=5886 RepID=A0A8S1M751_PARPR|nr:unnamed protein product [Paramecium primaurelia]
MPSIDPFIMESIDDDIYSDFNCAGFGVWSRYVPLSNVLQIGEIGILDSSCFHLFRIQDKTNSQLYFLQYECVNSESKTIIKYFQFLGSDGSDFIEEIQINEALYEYVWYFQGFVTIPSQKQVTIYYYEQVTQIFSKQLQIEFSFEGIKSNLIIGGDLKVSQNSPFFRPENNQLSYFPGNIEYLFDCYFYEPDYFLGILQSNKNTQCLCQKSAILKIGDVIIQKLDQLQFVSQQINCQQFLFSSWIKIKEIYSQQDEFVYQLFKLSGNFQNPYMIQDNLCAFQLFYKFSSQGNQIIFKTYSYTFPSLNIDFSNNSFLKTEIFDIDCDIQLWHYILVQKFDTSISISITFYQNYDQMKLNKNLEVKQYNMVQFKLLYGNILQSKSNYLEISIIDLKFINCPDNDQPQINCHPTCKECDGPTKEDCLSCFELSNRIYLPDFKECICEYGTIDQNDQCIHFLNLNFILIQEIPLKKECLYGYFELNDNCFQCPSIINNNIITCLECVQNPSKWNQTLLCETILLTDKNGNITNYLTNQNLQYIQIGNDIQFCFGCDQKNPTYNQFDQIESIFKFKRFCQSLENDCYSCAEGCLKCQLQKINLYCSEEQVNIPTSFYKTDYPCQPPNFIDFYEKCFTCQIQHCLYCFNYLANDPTKTTLGFYQENYLVDEEIKVGCAQCTEGFIYDFKKGQCINKKPTQENCLRSFINLNDREICTLSAINDFSFALEMINCQIHIFNCLRCIQTLQQILKCLICEDGYLVSSRTGICTKCPFETTKQCFEDNTLDPWKWLVQGFTIQFLPNRPIFTGFVYRPKQLITECLHGYENIRNECKIYCDETCSVCEPNPINKTFFCGKCKLNYYKEPQRVQLDGKCINCPSLCQVCQERPKEEINKINPYFIITPENLKYTYRCIQKILNHQVQIDPNLNIAQYCYQDNCNYNLELNFGDFDCSRLNFVHADLERYYNYQYFNEIGLQQWTLSLHTREFCEFNDPEQLIENTVKENIFSIQFIRLKFQGTSMPIKLNIDQFKFSLIKFDQIIMSDLIFDIEREIIFIFQNRNLPVDLKMLNMQFYSIANSPISMSIQGENILNVNLQDISIFNINFENQVIFNLVGTDQSDHFKFIILNQRIVYLEILLYFYCKMGKKVYIQKILLLIHVNFIIPQFIIIKGVSIKNSLLNKLNLINSIEKTTLTIRNIEIVQNQIFDSKFIIFNDNFDFNDIFIKDNHFISTQFISQISQVQVNSEIQMNNIKIQGNIIQNFSLFVTEQKWSSSQVSYLLQNLYFEDNIISCNQEQFLITINCFSLCIQNIFLRNTTNYRFISLLAVPLIRIQNVIYENLLQDQKVQKSYNCFKNCFSRSQLLQVTGFSNITLNKITIKNQFSIDQSIISIQSNPFIMQNLNENILITNVEFTGNILLKQNQGIFFSLLEQYSEKPQFIKIDNLKFEQNIFHQYNTDPSKTSASLFYFNSAQSIMILNNIICINNSFTNSTQSFFSLFSFEILIQNFKVQNHNYIEKEFWIQYYDINLQEEYSQNEITYAISNSFKIETIGGVLQTTVTKLTILNGEFNYIIAQSSQIFNIITQGDGIIIIKNCSITNAYNQLISKVQNDGAFTINGKNSLLSINFENITLINVLNKLSSSIFSISPSSTYNNIELKNIISQNCYSLIHQIINFEADFQNAQKNKVKIENFRLIQNEQALLTFLQSLGKINLIEIQKVISDNSIMNFQGCELILNKIQIEGIILSSIIKVQDSKLITLMNCKFINIQTFYPLHLVDIQQQNIQSSSIYIHNLNIQNLNHFTFNKQTLKYFDFNNIELEFSQCSLKINDIGQMSSKQEFVLTFFDDIYTNSNQNGSLIKLKTKKNQTRVYFSKVLLLNNNCKNCWNGLLFLELTDFQYFRISELSCINNSIKDYGCIWAKAEIKINSILFIDHSSFITNYGRLGSGIFVQNLRIKLQNSKIINNTASFRGGGFYFEEGTDRFTIKSTIIINNSANEAGGVFLYGNSSLSQNNFIQSLLLFNYAKFASNNINELPSHLSLSINQLEMLSQEIIMENRSYQVLLLKPFNIISQDHYIQTNFLFVPSGQQILNFQLFNPQLFKYLNYITEFSIKFKNSRNEQQINFLNSACDIQQQIFDIKSQKIIESITISTISFNQQIKSFNLGSLQLSIDPYEQKDKIQEILIFCKTEYQEESLAYRMRVNSFLCQLGEFYVFSGCQKCQSEQGFYSVTYNTTKCSLFDKNRFEAITSNKIQLKPGYWRSSYITDNVELCYKDPSHCLGGWVVGDDLCFIGHIGGLCEECDRYNLRGDGQFFKNQQQLDCQQCEQLSKRLIAFFLISIWAIFSTLLTIRSVERTNQLYVQLKLYQNQKFVEILFKLQQDHESILLKLFLNYFWIFSLIFTFNISFSISLNIVKPSNDTSYFMANFFECLLAEIQGIELIYSRILVMFSIMVCQILIIFIGFQLLDILKFYKFYSRIISITVLYLYIQNYASLINQFFSILAIRRISDLNYIQGDVSLIYGSQSHISWIYGFVIPGSLLIGLILPLSLFFLLYINKDQHKKINFRRHIGYLFNEYTQKNYFWEIIKLWKKTIIIIILIYFETDIYLKASLLGLCVLIYSVIAQNYKPYILHKLNILDIKSAQFCQIAIFLATVKYICEQQDKKDISYIIQTFIIFDSIVLGYPFIIDILKVYYKKYKLQIMQLLLKGFQTLRPNFIATKYLKKKINFLIQKEEKSKSNIKKLKQMLFSKNQKRYQPKINLQLVNTNRKKLISIKTVKLFQEKVI